MELSGVSDGPGLAFLFQNAMPGTDFGGNDSLVIQFDALISEPLVASAFHMHVNTMGPAFSVSSRSGSSPPAGVRSAPEAGFAC